MQIDKNYYLVKRLQLLISQAEHIADYIYVTCLRVDLTQIKDFIVQRLTGMMADANAVIDKHFSETINRLYKRTTDKQN